jgi:hypothetical protein
MTSPYRERKDESPGKREGEGALKSVVTESTLRLPKAPNAGPETQDALTPTERLRMRMWRERESHTRATGLMLLITSGALLAVSFVTGYPGFEVVSIVSFVAGVFLLASEAEATVKLLPSAEAELGPLLSLSGDLRARGFEGNATYVPQDDGQTVMQIGRKSGGGGDSTTLLPVGRGLVKSYERELGRLRDAEPGYVQTWLPRVLVKGLGLTEGAKIKVSESGDAKAVLRRPFVRPLCVREDFNVSVCALFGCPLVSSVGEALATSEKRKVLYLGCDYDRLTQTATAAFVIKDNE